MLKKILLLDDSSIKNIEFIFEENFDKIKSTTNKTLGSNMLYTKEEMCAPNQLGNTALNNLII